MSNDAIIGIIKDVIDDIDMRVNDGSSKENTNLFQDENLNDQLQAEEESILNKYCFGDIYSSRFGFRSLLEYEKECEEGSDCQRNIDHFMENDVNDTSFDMPDRVGNLVIRSNKSFESIDSIYVF